MKKIYLLMVLLSICFKGIAQNDCNTAIALPTEGGTQTVNYVEGTSDYWYSYTSGDEDVAVTIMYCGDVSLNIAAQPSCEQDSRVTYGSLYCDIVNYKGRGIKLQVAKGETYYVHIMAYQAFESFDVDVQPIKLGGATCEDAIVLTDGENCIPTNISGYSGTTWVTYTPTVSGRLTIKAPEVSYLSSVKKYINCEDNTGTYVTVNSNMIQMGVEEGETVLLTFGNTEPLNLTIDCVTIEPGKDCELPIEATEGNNNLCKATEKGDHWYRFTPSKNGYIEISACNFEDFFDGYVYLYKDCDTRLTTGGSCPEGSGFYLRYKVEANQEYKFNIQANTSRNEDFNFSVEITDSRPGDDCDTPIPAQQGKNAGTGNAGDIWYSYTPTKDCYLEISNCGTSSFNGYVTLYTDCTGWVASGSACTNGGSTLKTIVHAGTTYQIKWTLNSPCPEFTFTLAEIEIMPGDICSNPLTASLGENILPSLENPRSTYYTYTATQTGWLNVSICRFDWIANSSGTIEIKSDCNSISLNTVQESCKDGTGVNYKIPVEAERSYIIHIMNSKTFTDEVSFNLSEEDFSIGDDCSVPIIVEDVTAPVNVEKTIGNVWYTFTAGEEGFYTISSSTLPAGYGPTASSLSVKVGDCSAQTINAPFDYTINTYSIKVYAQAGASIYVSITIGVQTKDVTWEVAYKEAKEGEVCSKAIPVEGTFTCPGLSNDEVKWYSITPEKKGELTISTCGTQSFPRMEFYTSCESSPSASSTSCSDQSGNFMKAEVGAGMTYFLKIQSAYNETQIEITLEEAPVQPGDICSDPLQAVVGENTLPSLTIYRSTYYTYTSTQDGWLHVSIPAWTNQEDGKIEIMEDCDSEPLYDRLADSEKEHIETEVKVEAEKSYIICITNTTVFDEPVTFTITEKEFAEGEICSKAIKVEDDSFICPVLKDKEEKWYSIGTEKTGTLNISTCGTESFPYMELYTACGEKAIAVSQTCDNHTGNYLEIETETTPATYLLRMQNVEKETRVEIIFKGSSIEMIENSSQNVLILPNPNDGRFHVYFAGWPVNEEATVEISNNQGQVIFRNTIHTGTSPVIQMENATPGIYLLKVTGSASSTIQKFIIR